MSWSNEGIARDKSTPKDPKESIHHHGIEIEPTHRLEVQMGVASADGSWKIEPLTVECWYRDYDSEGKGTCASLPLFIAATEKAKESFPDATGAFIYHFTWQNAVEIAPQPDLSDLPCMCMLGEGGIYQPDTTLELEVGVAQPDHTWFAVSHTTQAATYRNMDRRFLGEVEKNWPGKHYFIIKHHWNKAKKLNNTYGYSNEEWDRIQKDKGQDNDWW
jgi:hypothetical protein